VLILEEVRCPHILPDGTKCNRRLADVKGQAQIKCPKCKALVHVDTEEQIIYIKAERRK
jgi:phage FluMu protein Com